MNHDATEFPCRLLKLFRRNVIRIIKNLRYWENVKTKTEVFIILTGCNELSKKFVSCSSITNTSKRWLEK